MKTFARSHIALTRRSVLLSLAACAVDLARLEQVDAAGPLNRPLVGAIRWDAWYSPGSVPTTAVQRTLSPQKYHWRLPFFAIEDAENRVTLPSLSDDVMELEIAQAAYAGLDYWAFAAYPQDSSMSDALQRYLKSPSRRHIGFCMFTQLEYWGTEKQPTAMIDQHIALMRDDGYVRVAQGRPLYFLGFITESKANDRWDGLGGLHTQIDRFRAQAVAQGVGYPYIVVTGTPRDGKSWAAALGADAIGAYAIADGQAVGDFAALARVAETGWQTMAGSGLPVVPTVMAGWDRRRAWKTLCPGNRRNSREPASSITSTRRHLRSWQFI